MTFRSIKLLLSLPQISSFQSVLQPSKDGFWKRGEALGVGSMSPSCRQPLAALGHQEWLLPRAGQSSAQLWMPPCRNSLALMLQLGTVWAQFGHSSEERIGEDFQSFVC